MMQEVITIDGPTSSGKNSVGFLLAKKLGYQFIDTGSIYRAGCLFIIRNNVATDDLQKVVQVFKDLKIEINVSGNENRLIANGEDVTDILHGDDVTRIVPQISAIREVREATKAIQKKLGEDKGIVMTGRDIGSEIFPDSKYKFFLTAKPEVRAKRRYEQLKSSNPSLSYEQVLKDTMERDQKDSTRAVSPMRVPKDAVVIDNSNLTIDETVEKILENIK